MANESLLTLPQIGRPNIALESLNTLNSKCWVNDEIINTYLTQVWHQSPLRLESNHVFSSFFYTKLERNGFNSVASWTFSRRKNPINLFLKKRILIPINISNTHWILGCVDIPRREIWIICSLHRTWSKQAEIVWGYLNQEHGRIYNKELIKSEWKLFPLVNFLPHQGNQHDCGVWVCIIGCHILSSDLPFECLRIDPIQDVEKLRMNLKMDILL